MPKLGADDRKVLHDAMLGAFPHYGDLEVFVRLYLGRSLPEIVQPCGTADAVHALLEEVEARGMREVLLGALAETRGDSPDMIAVVDRLRGESVAPPSLPRLQRFLGRDQERAELAAKAVDGDGAAICIYGDPGAGKSALALAVLDEVRVVERFRGRRWFVRLDGARSGAAIWGEIRQAMGLPVGGIARDVVLQGLGRGGALVLDNGETPWDDDPEGTAAVLRALGQLRGVAFLLTIRGRRRLPLDLRWHERPVSGLRPGDARRLFEEIARASANAAVEAALDALARLPLAVVLLAGVARTNGVDEALRRWKERRTAALTAGVTEADARHRSWLAVLDTVLASPQLGEGARRLAGWLALLPDGAADEDIVALGSDAAHEDAAQLEGAGLASREGGRGGRLRMLAPVREGIRERQTMPDDDARAMAHYVTLLVERGGQILREGGREALTRLSVELGNLETAIRWHANAGDWESTASSALRLTVLLQATGDGDGAWLEALLRTDPEPGRPSRLQAVKGLGDVALARSDHETARRLYEEARTLFVKISDVHGEANCILRLGSIALERSDHRTAGQLYGEAQALFVEVGNVLGEANCIQRLGDVALSRSDHSAAGGLYEEARTLHVKVGNVLGEANCIQRLGDISLRRSDHETARRLFGEARPLFVKIGDVHGEGNCVQRLGDIALSRSDHGTAGQLYREARLLFVKIGNVLGEANCIQRLGDIALRRSDHETAGRLYGEARPLFVKIGDVLGEANCIQRLGDIALLRSDHGTAGRLYEDARTLYIEVGDVLGEANCILSLGDIVRARSDHETARRLYGEARPLFAKVGDVLGEANCIQHLGDIARALSEHGTAERLFEEARTLHVKVGDVLGEANCIQGLGEIALRRSDYGTAERRYEEARTLHVKVGDVLGEANCIQGLGEIAFRRSDQDTARARLFEALAKYQLIGEPYSTGWTLRRLARLSSGADRERFITEAQAAWRSIDRNDLVASLDFEFALRRWFPRVATLGVAAVLAWLAAR
jgi:tetratricopeptide (TPR) repeat protein